MITLNDEWQTSERGNTWLVDDDGNHVAWFDIASAHRLEVSVTPGNYPGFLVALLTPELSTDAHLAKHIMERCRGWSVRKCNIDGVSVVDGRVA